MRQLLFYMNRYKNKQYSCQNKSIYYNIIMLTLVRYH